MTQTSPTNKFKTTLEEPPQEGLATFGISFSSTHKDDRTNKRYLRNTALHVYQTGGPEIKTNDLPYTRDEFPVPHLQTALEGVMPKLAARSSFGNEFGYYLERTFKAQRPKTILSPDEALEKLGKDAEMSLGEILVDGLDKDLDAAEPLVVILAVAATLMRRVLKRHNEIRDQVKRQNAACTLANWVAKEADKEARKVVRFEQRLAALVAELESEQEVQLTERLKKGGKLDKDTDEWNAEIADPNFEPKEGESKEPWDKRSVEAARKFADRFKRSASPSGFHIADGGLKIKLHEVE